MKKRIILVSILFLSFIVGSLSCWKLNKIQALEETLSTKVDFEADEVRELFLAESMIMGVGGGVLGLLFGFTLGKILSIILSSVSLLKGQGIMNITTIPWFFVLFIMLVSFIVGMITGWYPSKRARQISALNALRYE